MAVTIEQSPQTFTPSDNPVTWVFSSDQTSQPNFYFLVEVYLEDTPSVFEKIETHKIYPELENKAHFDASSITQRYCDAINPNLAFSNIEKEATISRKFYIKVIEYYGSPVSVGANQTSSTISPFKSRLKKAEFVNYDSQEYVFAPSITPAPKYLTLYPRSEKIFIRENERYLLTGITNDISYSLGLQTTKKTGASNFSTKLVTSYPISVFDVGLTNLKALFPVHDFSNLDTYKITILNTTTTISESIEFKLDESCQYDKAKRIHFLNSLGGLDSFSFNLLSREKYDVESFGYEKEFGSFDENGDYQYSLDQGTTVDYQKQFSKSLMLTSDWILDTVYNWLTKELFTSPAVYIENGLEFQRVKVKQSNFQEKINENDTLVKLDVELVLETDSSVLL